MLVSVQVADWSGNFYQDRRTASK